MGKSTYPTLQPTPPWTLDGLVLKVDGNVACDCGVVEGAGGGGYEGNDPDIPTYPPPPVLNTGPVQGELLLKSGTKKM